MSRWYAVVTYRHAAGPVDVPHDLEELGELQDLVELGPHWGTIERIEVTYRGIGVGLTVEDAARE